MSSFRGQILFVFTVLLLFSCSPQISTFPIVENIESKDYTLCGSINYDGNPDYLPRKIKDCGDNNVAKLIYRHDVCYNGTGKVAEMFTSLIPTTMVGTPTGSDVTSVHGQLDIIMNGEVKKSYAARSDVVTRRGVFAGGTDLTQSRKIGLTAVRDNIDMQIEKDSKTIEETIRQKED